MTFLCLSSCLRGSVFSIEWRHESVGTQDKPLGPRRRFAHPLADGWKRGRRVSLDNQLIVDMGNNSLLPERLHGIAEHVTADGLGDVFAELGAIGFEPFPFLCAANSEVGQHGRTESAGSKPRFYIRQPSAGRKLNKQHRSLADEANSVRLCCRSVAHGGRGGFVYVPPELDNIGIRARHAFTKGSSSSSDKPISAASIAFKAPTEPP